MKKVIIKIKIIVIFMIVVLITMFISGYFSERVDTYISSKAQLYSSSMIEDAITKEVVPLINADEMINIVYNNEKVESIYINTSSANQIMANVNKSIEKAISSFPKKDLSLPIGLILSDTLFSNIGPNIDIQIEPMGIVTTDIVSRIEEYGINNSILRIDIKTIVTFVVLVPLNKNEIVVETNIPLVIQTLNGEVPRFYVNSSDGKTPFTND